MRQRLLLPFFFLLCALMAPCIPAALAATAETALRVCVPANNLPFASRDKNGHLQGFDIDMWEALSLPRPFVYIETDFPTALAQLEDNSCDMVLSNISVTEAREKRLLFSAPHIRSSLHAMVLAESPISRVEDLRKRTVGVIKGSTAEHLAFTTFKSGVIIALDNFRSLLQLLREGKIDAILHDKPRLQRVALKGLNTRILEPSLSIEVYAYGFPKGKEDLRDEVNAALTRLTEQNRIRTIYATWFGAEME